MKVGLLGGTFDPIHLGHIKIAEKVLETFKLEKIIFIPNGNPPHKFLTADKYMRYKMVELAIKGNSKFDISNIEVLEDKKMFTVDTLKELKKKYTNYQYYLIIGRDSFNKIYSWKDYKGILKLCKLVVVNRSGENSKNILADNVLFINDIDIDISSTDIRNNIKMKKSTESSLNMEVEKFIKFKGLYK